MDEPVQLRPEAEQQQADEAGPGPGEARQGVTMQPGMHVIPGVPSTFAVNAVVLEHPETGEQQVRVMLHVEHATGSTVLVLDPTVAHNIAGMIANEAEKALSMSGAPGLLVPQGAGKLIVPGR